MPEWTAEGVDLYHGDCIQVMRELPEASVDAVVTDPPYGINFMGKAWDGAAISAAAKKEPKDHTKTRERSASMHAGSYDLSLTGNTAFQLWFTQVAAEALRVLKPGGHLLAFGGTRTWHRLAVAIEDAGFEVRDSIAWMYGSGFPKSLNLKNDWQGWGTALKPAHEPIVVARKPLHGTVAENVLRHGTGALNIDGSRIGTDENTARSCNGIGESSSYDLAASGEKRVNGGHTAGRWPANVILDESQAAELDRQSGVSVSRASAGRNGLDSGGTTWNLQRADDEVRGHNDSGGASRFFYVPKANKEERPRDGDTAHPTVKPLELMRYLVKLVTPPGGTVLEPFAGSGTTLEACLIEGFQVIGIEVTEEYLPVIMKRLNKPIEVVLW